jgi:hypothetical protein
MTTLRLALLLTIASAVPALAEPLCDRPAEPALLETLVGDWSREGSISQFNETLDEVRAVPAKETGYVITAEQHLSSTYLDYLAGDPLSLTGLSEPAYDVDRVDDVLDTTERADLADILSDTLCGPETLPQWQATLFVEDRDGMQVTGTYTLIGYFTDRLLLIGELELRSEEALIFMTETMLLRPQERDD